jgi:hypothetical protein
MARRIIIKAVPNQNPNIGLYVQALIRLARQLQEEESARQEQPAEAKIASDGGAQ